MRRVNRMHRILLILILLLGFISVGYAALQTTLNINGTTSIKRNTWDVHFENIQAIEGNITPTQVATITSPTTVNFNVPLAKQGDFYKFEVDVVNAGTIDAMISVVSNSLTAAQKKYITYDVSYKNAIDPIVNIKDALPVGNRKTLTVFVKYRDDVPVSDLPTNDQSLNLNFSIKYVQDDGTSNKTEMLTNSDSLIGKSNPVDKDYNTSTDEEKGNMYAFYHPATAQTPTLTDYRYIGNKPNNYIKFNNETWRIIGVFDGRIKIIRDESIGAYSWDEELINEWPGSSLEIQLNTGDFWLSLTDKSKKQLDTVKYYLGAAELADNLKASDYYNFERGTTVYNSDRSKYWDGYVGLMYPSDYVYTFANGVDDICFNDAYICNTSNPNSSWIYRNTYEQWTISPSSRGTNISFSIINSGYIYAGRFVFNSYDVRPVVYLKSDVKLSGTGTISDPYIIK